MKKIFSLPISLAIALVAAHTSQAATTYSDSSADIDPGISNAGGTLDFISAEVSHTSTDLIFNLTVNGNVSTTDWGNFMIGISTGKTAGTSSGNGWNRPINMTSPLGGMDFWIGSWVNAGGGSQLWTYSGTSWSGPGALAGYAVTAGATSQLTYTVSRATLGLTGNDTFYFDAYSSGGGGSDSAVDALANPNVSITGWAGPYTSNTANGLYIYAIPEPSTPLLMGLGLAGLFALRRLQKV